MSSSLIGFLFAAAIGAAWPFLMRIWLRRLKSAAPFALDGANGTIRPDRWSAWIVIVSGVIFILGAAALMLFASDVFWIGLVFLLFGLCWAGCMFPSVTSVHALRWSNTGIDGASNMMLGTLGLKRTTIAWREIVRSGTTLTLYWYLEANDGRRVYWSFLYPGNGAFAAAIQHHRPDIEVPPLPSYLGAKSASA